MLAPCHADAGERTEREGIMAQMSFGSTIATLRKQRGMTQAALAEKMGVTDKAVSKWERDVSFPDVAALPRLAETLEVSVDELLQAKTAAREREPQFAKAAAMADLVLKAVALAMGVGVVALTILDEVEPLVALRLLGVGVACLALSALAHTDGEKW